MSTLRGEKHVGATGYRYTVILSSFWTCFCAICFPGPTWTLDRFMGCSGRFLHISFLTFILFWHSPKSSDCKMESRWLRFLFPYVICPVTFGFYSISLFLGPYHIGRVWALYLEVEYLFIYSFNSQMYEKKDDVIIGGSVWWGFVNMCCSLLYWM